MKKTYIIRALSLLIAAASLLSACSGSEVAETTRRRKKSQTTTAITTLAPEITTDPGVTTVTDIPVMADPTVEEPDISDIDPAIFENASRKSEYILLYDITAGRTLYVVGADAVIYPASITKLLTVLYALTIVPDTDEIFTVGEEISWIAYDSSKAHIRKNEQYTMKDMMACMLLPSGNDAAYSMAVNCGLRLSDDDSVTRREAFDLFIDGMNAYGRDVLGLTGTHFDSPDGYHSENHYTTMDDLRKITLAAYKNPVIAEMASTDKYTAVTVDNSRKLNLSNTNQLIQSSSKYYYPYAKGMKTGFHSDAGSCVAATAEKDGQELLVLVMRGPSNTERFADAITFFELGFAALEELEEAA